MSTDTIDLAANFQTAEIPKQVGNRKPAPNPFEGRFPADDKAISITLPAKTPEDEKVITRLSNQARKAATAVDRTGRVQRTDDAKAGTATLAFWTVAKRKPRGAGETTDTPKSDAKASDVRQQPAKKTTTKK